MEATLGRLDSGTGEPAKEDRLFEIRTKIRQKAEDFQKSLMILSDGDMVQYNALRRSTVGEYLIKLDNYVTQIESIEKSKNGLKDKGLKVK